MMKSTHGYRRCKSWRQPFSAVAVIILAIVNIKLGKYFINASGGISVAYFDGPEAAEVIDEQALQLYMHARRMSLVNESSVVNFRKIYHHFDDDMQMTIKVDEELGIYCPFSNSSMREEYLKIFTDPERGDVISGEFWGTFCCALLGFLETGGIKKHVLITTWDDNWGEFSDYVPNRTTNWVNHNECGQGNEYWQYLNHSNLSAVFTVQHQWFDHPKVFSVPLGPTANVAGALRAHANSMPNRSNLLLISQSSWGHRPAIEERVIANFNGTVSNRYNDGSDYLQLMQNSKFVLCPSGMGWDTYRAWEALVLGTIPILETYYRKDGFYRAYAGLPVLWVDHFDNVTQALLVSEYPRILSGAREYIFEKLTNQWWIDLINSYRV